MALEKSQGNVGAAIEALRKYVDVFQTDRDAWEELGALYVQARPACFGSTTGLLQGRVPTSPMYHSSGCPDAP